MRAAKPRRSCGFVIVLCGFLAGCSAGGATLAESNVDSSVVGSISPQTAASGDIQKLSDEATVRNAVTSADLAQLSGKELAWANADTGSRGSISALAESNEQGILCRSFTTTRESFEGVALYQGKACMAGPGNWEMLAFTAE